MSAGDPTLDVIGDVLAEIRGEGDGSFALFYALESGRADRAELAALFRALAGGLEASEVEGVLEDAGLLSTAAALPEGGV